MAIELGTSSGFVVSSPSVDPNAGAAELMSNNFGVTKDISPSTASRIIEIGWWCGSVSEEANFEVGLYAADGGVVPGEAGTLLYSNITNAKGTTTGWKKVTGLSWLISPSTPYWLAVQVDYTASLTYLNTRISGAYGTDLISGTTLPSTAGGGALAWATGMHALYAVWVPPTTSPFPSHLNE